MSFSSGVYAEVANESLGGFMGKHAYLWLNSFVVVIL